MEAFHHFRQIHDRAYVRTEGSAARQPGGAELTDEIGSGTRGKRCHHRLAVAVIEHQLIGILGQARFLLLARLLEAIVIQFDIETSGQEHGAIVQRSRVAVRHLSDRVQVFVQT